MIKTEQAMMSNITRSLSVIATVLTLSQAIAANPVRLGSTVSKIELERNLDRALNKHLSFPVLAKADMTGEVFVSFVIDKEGKVEVLEISSTNQELKEHVMRKLARIDIGENPDGIWKTTHMRITFKPEQT